MLKIHREVYSAPERFVGSGGLGDGRRIEKDEGGVVRYYFHPNDDWGMPLVDAIMDGHLTSTARDGSWMTSNGFIDDATMRPWLDSLPRREPDIYNNPIYRRPPVTESDADLAAIDAALAGHAQQAPAEPQDDTASPDEPEAPDAITTTPSTQDDPTP